MTAQIQSNRCEDCAHFRRPTPLAAILKQQITESHEEVLKAIDEVSGKDEAFYLQERAWVEAGAAGESVWPHRPRTASYCGLYESHDYYYVCEAKNHDGACPDFTLAERWAESDCGNCVHRVTASGDARDQELLFQIAERIAYSMVQSSPLEAEYQRVEKRVGAMKAYEVREAYRNYGWLARPPAYLDCCKAHSSPGRFVLSQSMNPAGQCQRFSRTPQIS